MSLILKNVSKAFVGKQAVDDISLILDKPGVYGLLGTNGAGKTTTIRMLLGIIKKDSGEITWKGKAVDRKNVNKLIDWVLSSEGQEIIEKTGYVGIKKEE